ncbi:DUF4920 domain-containing protein [bacterium]|nr:DUF4920 domain-containing protein [bacterium]
MKSWKLVAVLVLALALMGCSQQKKSETTSDVEMDATAPQITLTEVTPLGDVVTSPDQFVGKTVLIEGHVTGRCGGSGCWVSLDTEGDKDLIIRTADESFIFPAECVDQDIQVQGKLMVKSVASNEEHDHMEGEADHECPDPEYYFHPEAMKIKV